MEKLNASDTLFEEAKRHLVGGVNSPVRAFRAVGGSPRFVESANGAFITDASGKSYIDFLGSWGPMIFGHRPSFVTTALNSQMKKGFSFGAPTKLEIEMAILVKEAFPSIEQLRFTSSGTEATMSALRLARGFTRRERIVKFEGAYHGHSDGLLVAAGSGATTFGVPSSAGVPSALAKNTWVLPFNDAAAAESLFRTQGINIAAVIVEPVCGNMGVVAPRPGFLALLRDLCARHQAVLIFDEVMTGFRLSWGGAQEMYKVRPDLTCLGKIVGGGLPVGVFGGRREIMSLLAPEGPVYQAGTLSGNPLAMAAGLATLKALRSRRPYAALERSTADLTHHIQEVGERLKIPVQVNRVGSMFTVFFTEAPVYDYFSAKDSDAVRYAQFFHALLENGIWMPPSQFEAAFVSTAHTPAIMRRAKRGFEKALESVKNP